MEAQHALLGHLLVHLVVYLSMPPEKYKREFKPWAGYFTTISRIDKGKNQSISSSTSGGPWFFRSALETLSSFILKKMRFKLGIMEFRKDAAARNVLRS